MNSGQSDSESNVSGFIRYSNEDIKKLYLSVIKNMKSINQDVLEVERNLKHIVGESGLLEKQMSALLQALPRPDENMLVDS